MKKKNYLDLFAGAGGLSEGFILEGFNPIAHIEMDEAACNTLRTRQAYHWLKKNKRIGIYNDYLEGRISRHELYREIPKDLIDSVICSEINKQNIKNIFSEIDKKLYGAEVDLIIGGPPCQAYSLVGRARDSKKMIGDKRNYLYLLYCEFLKKYKPTIFVFENVLGLLSAKDSDNEKYVDKMMEKFKSLGYEMQCQVIDCSQYGVPQSRKRVIIIGKAKDKLIDFPIIKKMKNRVLVKELLKDLPPLKSGEGEFLGTEYISDAADYLYKVGVREKDLDKVTYHVCRKTNARDLDIYRRVVELWNDEGKRLSYNSLPNNLKTHKNRTSFVDRYKVVEGNSYFSHTMVAHIAKDGHYYIHPDINQNRTISVREAARIQSFPDNYYFESKGEKPSMAPALKQIGNAVPVVLSRRIAKAIKVVIHKGDKNG
ncbi:MAG: DNA cytosine methyltransferase [Erysipelotrichales bacterium]|nr:DNA cytosine methyltransferase [Erysipelotrichales bacterium]